MGGQVGAWRQRRSSEDVVPFPSAWQPWKPKYARCLLDLVLAYRFPHNSSGRGMLFPVQGRAVLGRGSPQERGSLSLPFYPKPVEILSSGGISQNKSVWDGLWEGKIGGFFLHSGVL